MEEGAILLLYLQLEVVDGRIARVIPYSGIFPRSLAGVEGLSYSLTTHVWANSHKDKGLQ
jgi:hypothetical protein